jgi:hypothetical protein
MRTSLSVLLFIIAMSYGCTKEVTPENLNTNSSSTENSSLAADTYLPLTKGTYWKYNAVNDAGDVNAVKYTVLGIPKLINGKRYQSVLSTTDNNKDTAYYNQSMHDYYVYKGANNGEGLEILFLKDDAPVGAKWYVPSGSLAGIKVKCYGKIIAKNMTMKVGNKTYTNVIHSYVEIRQPLFFTYILVGKQDYYVAKNIGIIKNESDVVFPSKSSSKLNIFDYSIK